jgi:predicted DNA-binding transcriptional regulator YafY
MKINEEEKYNQSRRILHIYRLFLTNRKMTANEVADAINEIFPDYSKRSIQRDLRILSDGGFITVRRKGGSSYWSISNNRSETGTPVNIRENELLSFHILKTYLKTFHGTTIEKDINELSRKLETLAPGNVFLEEQFYGDQNEGNFDYSGKHEILRLCIKNINEKNWIKISYERLYDSKIKEYEIFPQFLYTYSGTIYLVAYNPTWKRSTNFAVHHILSMDEVYEVNRKEPVFDYDEFRKHRFAVIEGDLEKVRLMIEPDYIKYFENRFWHPSQIENYDMMGNLILEFEVPLAQDFIRWILKWSNAIAILEPPELKKMVVEILKKGVERNAEL